ncbi:MAG: N-acetylglucosamine-6-phosphate deacetylase, partial [Pedosphaera parvula]|nr:N-acetylglucosamine-6-phosphate deacetylase [Pedosphaera parvula]
MSDGEVIAWHYADGRPVRLRWRDGVITALEAAPGESPEFWLAPVLVDIQINGYAGVDFQRDGQTVEALIKATRGLRQAGCTRYALTLITDEWSRLMARLRHLRELRGQSPELMAAIFGWHIEGPFLSAEPGFRGAHNPDVMCDPTPARLDELRAITENDPVLITVAPERKGAPEAIRHAVSLGFKVSLGHTNTPVDALRTAMVAGATGFTHLANGCPKDLDRHDNILWRVFDNPGLTVGLIPDMIHVSPICFRLIHRLIDP